MTNPFPMTSDEQEIESRKYGSGVVLILPLTSGSFAILDNSRSLREILDTEPSADHLRSISESFTQRLKPFIIHSEPDNRERERTNRSASTVTILDDL